MAKKQKLQVRTNEVKEFHLFDNTFLARVDFARKCGVYAQPRVFQRADGEKLVRLAAKKGPNDKIIWDTYLWEQSWGVQPNVLSPEESRFWLTVLLHPFMGDIVDAEVIDLILQTTQVAELTSDMPRSMLIEGIGRRAQSKVLPLVATLLRKLYGGAEAFRMAIDAFGGQSSAPLVSYCHGLIPLLEGKWDSREERDYEKEIDRHLNELSYTTPLDIQLAHTLLIHTPIAKHIRALFDSHSHFIKQLDSTWQYRLFYLARSLNDAPYMLDNIVKVRTTPLDLSDLVWFVKKNHFDALIILLEKIVHDIPEALEYFHSKRMVKKLVDLYKSNTNVKKKTNAIATWMIQDGANAIAGLLELVVESNDAVALMLLKDIEDRGAKALLYSMIQQMPEAQQDRVLVELGVQTTKSEDKTVTDKAIEAVQTTLLAGWMNTAQLKLPIDHVFEQNAIPLVLTHDHQKVPEEGVLAIINAIRFRANQEAGDTTRDEQVRHYLSTLDSESVDELGAALLERYFELKTPTNLRWVPGVFAFIFGPKCAQTLLSNKHSRGREYTLAHKAVCQALRENASPEAIWFLHQMTLGTRQSVRTNAKRELVAIAESRTVSVETLVESNIPNYGFDENGQKQLFFETRPFSLLLRGYHDIAIIDDKGKPLSKLPTSQTVQAKAAKEKYKSLVDNVSKTQTWMVQQLEQAMISKRFWSFQDWQAIFSKNVVFRVFAAHLVWAVEPETSNSISNKYFAIGGDQKLYDAHYESIELTSNSQVHLPHTAEMPVEQRQQWQRWLDEGKMIQPFEQLTRQVFDVQSVNGAPNSVGVTAKDIAKLQGFGWQENWGSMVQRILSKSFFDTPFSVMATFEQEDPSLGTSYRLESVKCQKHGALIDWAEMPIRIRNELFAHLAKIV